MVYQLKDEVIWNSATHDESGRFRRGATHYVALATEGGEDDLVLELKEDIGLLKRLQVRVTLIHRQCAREVDLNQLTLIYATGAREVHLAVCTRAIVRAG